MPKFLSNNYRTREPMPPRYPCRWCNRMPQGYASTKGLREHVWGHHKEITPEILERHIVQTRYPSLDIDYIVQRYKDRLETMIGLQYQGIFIKKFLQTIGVARHPQADKGLMRFLKPHMKTPEEVTRAMADELCYKFLKASAETRFEGYLNRDISVLKKQGHDALIPIVRTLKLIQFTKKQLSAAIEEATAGDTE